MIDYRDTKTPANARAACIAGLLEGLRHANPAAVVDEPCYVARPEDNLIAGLSLIDFAEDFAGGAGQELAGKFRAVHSSAALAINCFAPLRANAHSFDLGERRGLNINGFKRRFPTGLARAQAPHLDVVASGHGEVVAIESKCLEYLTPKRVRFSERYSTDIIDERCDSPWFAEMLRLVALSGPSYRFLDAAQLIKHAFGLMRAAAEPTTLFYLYWEPMDADLSPLFEHHRAEIAAFADRVAGSSLKFASMSYPELWAAWDETGDPFLRGHVAALRARYEVPAWAWEGVEWRDGRLQSAGWLDELLDNPEAERAVAEDTIKRVMEQYGWSEAEARKLYGGGTKAQ